MTRTAARAQGALAIAALLAAVAVTVVLVATPVSSRPGPRSSSSAGAGAATVLPSGLKVSIQGGDPYVAYGLADRLSGAGAAMHAVQPATDGNRVDPATMIEYYDRGQQASAERVKALLGQGTLRRKSVFEPGVDVTIVLGKDLSHL